jgi:hypothetical protein
VLCELIPGGVAGQITAGQAAHILESITPADAVAAARCELAAEGNGGTTHSPARRLTPPAPALRESHSRACHPPYDPRGCRWRPSFCCLSRLAAIPCERAAGSRTGQSPAAQRRPQGVLYAAAREPIMPAAGKRAHPAPAGGYRAKARCCVASALPLDPETKRCSFGAARAVSAVTR